MGALGRGWEALGDAADVVREATVTLWLGLAIFVLSLPPVIAQAVMAPTGPGTGTDQAIPALMSTGSSPLGGSTASGLSIPAGIGAGLYSATITFLLGGALVVLFAQKLRGAEVSLPRAIDTVRANGPTLIVWIVVHAIVSLAFGVGSQAITTTAASLSISVAQILWGLATFFVIPAIVLSGEGAWTAFEESLSNAKREWLAVIVATVLLVVALTVVAIAVGGLLGPVLAGALTGTAGLGVQGTLILVTLGVAVVMAIPMAIYLALLSGIQVALYEPDATQA